jgi:uncharacterized protein YjbI with pentapeptide repeats
MDVFRSRREKLGTKEDSELGPIDESIIGELLRIVSDVAFSDEVAPSLDLRGLEFDRFVNLRNLDLSGVRFDYASFSGNTSCCRMVGTIFDGCAASQLMQGDFTGASFVGAALKHVSFWRAVLRKANFTMADLRSGSLEEAVCCEAAFKGAKLARAHCPRADFRGADLTEADLTDTALGNVRFDDKTLVRGAILIDATMPDEFRHYAEKRGAITGPSRGKYPLDEFDGTVACLQSKNADHALDKVIARMADLRKDLARSGCELNWYAVLEREFSEETMDIVSCCIPVPD